MNQLPSSARSCLIGCAILFAPLSGFSQEVGTSDMHRLLHEIASAEKEHWEDLQKDLAQKFSDFLEGAPLTERLNEWIERIPKEDDVELTALLQRAVRNFNALSDQKVSAFRSYYKNYSAPSFAIADIELVLDVRKNEVFVTTHLMVENLGGDSFLALDGKDHRVVSVQIDNQPLSRKQFRITSDELILLDLPESRQFCVTIESVIDPFLNGSFEGLYASGDNLITQCESEGARRIFFTLDRPDVLSRITTTLISDPKTYPVALSNGNCLEDRILLDGRRKVIWSDPIPKPSYLFAAVFADFSKIEDRFVTKGGREVSLEVYMPHGKERRAAYSLDILKAAMLFDEEHYDREYDLDSLKMVAVPDFNMGAMENKGLLIFNEPALLVDSESGTDAQFRRVATVVSHEYFHNWSGNRVTVRNWFELALKEAFTDMRTMLFVEDLFGSALVRPDDVQELRERQFPEEEAEHGHPIMVESYLNPGSIYDSTTYVKGREVFRTLQTYLNAMLPDGFRRAQNLYFERYDGQAVTFRELLSSANELLEKEGKDNLSQFELWFSQRGTPRIKVDLIKGSDKGNRVLRIRQSCLHPVTKEMQEPLLIPFSYEFLKKDGSIALPKQTVLLSKEEHTFEVDDEEGWIPVFLHDFCAPVIVDFTYSLEELSCLMQSAQDSFIQWEASCAYSLMAIERIVQATNESEQLAFAYQQALQKPSLSLLAKARLLEMPSLASIARKVNCFDFAKLKKARMDLEYAIATTCSLELEKLLEENQEPSPYKPNADQMAIRELRASCWRYLTRLNPRYCENLWHEIQESHNFHTSYVGMALLSHRESDVRQRAVDDFYTKWKDDKVVLNYWLRAQASHPDCTVAEIQRLMQVEGFDAKNPNHLRSLLCVFVSNLPQYHDARGEGYRFIFQQIEKIGQENPIFGHHQLAKLALIDFDHLPLKQKQVMRKEMEKFCDETSSPEMRSVVSSMLQKESSK